MLLCYSLEQTLLNLKAKLQQCDRLSLVPGVLIHSDSINIVLDKLRAGKLKVNRRWSSFLGRVLTWEIMAEGLPETFEEEFDGSSDRSAESEGNFEYDGTQPEKGSMLTRFAWPWMVLNSTTQRRRRLSSRVYVFVLAGWDGTWSVGTDPVVGFRLKHS